MNILIDIGHPAHVHYYRNLAGELLKKGHHVIWTVKDIPVARQLLDYYGFSYYVLPKKSDTIPGKVLKQFLYDLILLKICIQKKIDIAIGSSVSIVHVSKISRVRSIVFDDDDDHIQPLVTKFASPFADILVSPSALTGRRKRKDTIYYPGYQELAYLHPERFKPDPSVLTELKLSPGESFFVLRFNVFKAHHDIAMQGLDMAQKLKLVKILEPHGRIFINSERELESGLVPYKVQIDPQKIHSLIYYATMFLGDSQTMTSEAAILGTPALKCNTFAGDLSVPNELEDKYQLCYSFQPQEFDLMLDKINELLNLEDLKNEWNTRKIRMLNDKIDVTAFWSWLIDNYPQSIKLLRDDPEYPDRFGHL
jgi:predicted glycosyltransferase